MPLTAEMRRSIDQIRDYLFGGGYPDPVSNAEQLSFLFFFYLVESIDAENKARAEVLKAPYTSLFNGEWELRNPLNARVPSAREGNLAATVLQTGAPTIPRSRFRWSVWAARAGRRGAGALRARRGVPLLRRDRRRLGATTSCAARAWASTSRRCSTQVIRLVDGLAARPGRCRHQGRPVRARAAPDQAGRRAGPVPHAAPHHPHHRRDGGPDRSARPSTTRPPAPRVSWSRPTTTSGWPTPRPAASSKPRSTARRSGAAWATGSRPHELATLQARDLLRQRRRPEDGAARDHEPHAARPGQRAHPAAQRADHRRSTPASKAALGLPADGFHVVLANPPFSGRVDKDRIVDEVRIGSTSSHRTAVSQVHARQPAPRRPGRGGGARGRAVRLHRARTRNCAASSSRATAVEAVLSLPGGVFQPYSGVKTSVLFFRKGGRTEHVLFLHADDDGYQLDANHDTPIEADDLPALAQAYAQRDAALAHAGRRASRTPSGPRNGGSPTRPRCAPTTSTSRPAATGR